MDPAEDQFSYPADKTPDFPDLWQLYRLMFFSRLFEKAVKDLWNQGYISGEMHLGIGEEAINAGVVTQLETGDAMALDHRGTAPMLMRGVDPILLLREFLGREDGLCRGMGGHMHLYSQPHLAASSGIVGASGPTAVGFALAAKLLRPGKVALAFFGEGAINQGSLMESMNLAAVMKLPVIFLCKDNGWSLTTQSDTVTAGNLLERAEGFGLQSAGVNGNDVEEVWEVVRQAIIQARSGFGPAFLHVLCRHPEGHFLGDPYIRLLRQPIRQIREIGRPLLQSLTRREGTSFKGRIQGIKSITRLIGRALKDNLLSREDPLNLTRKKMVVDRNRLSTLEKECKREVQNIVGRAMMPATTSEDVP